MSRPGIYADGARIMMARPEIAGRPMAPLLLAEASDLSHAAALAHAADRHSDLVLALMDARDALRLLAPQSPLLAGVALLRADRALAVVAGRDVAAVVDEVAA
jgi:hypothetical protein